MNEDHDDLSALLAPVPAPTAGDQQQALRPRLELAIRNRTRWRACTRVGWAGVIFLMGVGLGWFLRTPANVPSLQEQVRVDTVFVPIPVPLEPPVDESSAEAVAPTPGELELQAELSSQPEQVARLYRQAGDGYLEKLDYVQANRCYRLSLHFAGPDGLELQPQDSWLLTSLKNSLYLEKTNASQTQTDH